MRYPDAAPLPPEEVARIESLIKRTSYGNACFVLGITNHLLFRALKSKPLSPESRERIVGRLDALEVDAEEAIRARRMAETAVDAYLEGQACPPERAERIRRAVFKPLTWAA